MFIGIYFFRLGKISSIICLKIFSGPLNWDSSLSAITIFLRFGLLIVSSISWMLWVRRFLHFHFLSLLCQCFIWYILDLRVSSISCILLVMFASMNLDLFPRFYISRVVSLCDFFIGSISIFKFWMVLFNSFTCSIFFHVIL